MKKISTKTHGFIDYGAGLGLLALPRLMHWNPEVTRLLTGAGLANIAYSLFTKYEMGLFKVLPMKTHLKLDGAQSLALASAPFLFVHSKKSVTGWLLGLSIFEALVTLNSQSRPRRKFLGFRI